MSNRKPVIFLSAGHYPEKDGYINIGFGIKEHEAAVKVVKNIETLYHNGPFELVYDLDIVPPGDLTSKVQYINSKANSNVLDGTFKHKNDYIVEIHFNAFNESAHGFETLYFPGSVCGYSLANNISEELWKHLPFTDRGIKERKKLYILRKSKIPAVIVELLFLDNRQEAAYLLHPRAYEILGRSVFEGINRMYY